MLRPELPHNKQCLYICRNLHIKYQHPQEQTNAHNVHPLFKLHAQHVNQHFMQGGGHSAHSITTNNNLNFVSLTASFILKHSEHEPQCDRLLCHISIICNQLIHILIIIVTLLNNYRLTVCSHHLQTLECKH